MQGKQRIPSYMKSHYMQKNSNIQSKEIDKLFKILAIYLSICWVANIFLWALCVTSWDLNDTEYILLKEGFAGGINKTLPIIFAEILSIFPYMFIYIIAFGVFFVYNFYVKEIKKRIFMKRDYLVSISLLLISIYASYVVFDKFYIFYNNLGILDQNNIFIDPIVIFTIVLPLGAAFIFLIIISVVSVYKNINFLNILKEKIIIIILSVSIIISQLGIFVYVPYTSYNKGYGTECMYIYVASGKFEEQKDRIYKTVSSGGDEVVEVLARDIDGNEHIYSLSSYVYSEDKDYLNIMILSIRRWHNEYKGTKKYLVIDDGKDMLGDTGGVLISLKKEFIDKRTANDAECFNGKK